MSEREHRSPPAAGADPRAADPQDPAEDRYPTQDRCPTEDRCPRGLPEELLSGYLDRALSQGRSQRVRLHLEDCDHCRRLYDEMQELREVTMSTRFVVPPDDQWREVPRSSTSRFLRGTGWLLVLVWLAAAGAYGLWLLITAPGHAWEKAFVFTGLSGAGMLFLSILLDRLKVLKTDRYRGVER